MPVVSKALSKVKGAEEFKPLLDLSQLTCSIKQMGKAKHKSSEDGICYDYICSAGQQRKEHK